MIGKKILILGIVGILVLVWISPVNAGMIDNWPILTLKNNTHLLSDENPFYNTYMNATFSIYQENLWSETYTDIIIEPGEMIESFLIKLDHKIDDDYKLYFGLWAGMRLYGPSDRLVGYAYAIEEGQDPPGVEPSQPPIIELPLADPRPTPIVMWGYASPPTKVGEGFVELNSPPKAPIIDGLDSGKPGISYEFTFNAVDPDEDNVRYNIEWGDGNYDTTVFAKSGENVKVSHTWADKGTFTITAKAEDEFGLFGPETTKTVTMPRGKAIDFNFNLLIWLFERFSNTFPVLRNLLRL